MEWFIKTSDSYETVVVVVLAAMVRLEDGNLVFYSGDKIVAAFSDWQYVYEDNNISEN